MPDVRERLISQGAEPLGGTPEQFADYVKAEIAKWSKVVAASGAPGRLARVQQRHEENDDRQRMEAVCMRARAGRRRVRRCSPELSRQARAHRRAVSAGCAYRSCR